MMRANAKMGYSLERLGHRFSVWHKNLRRRLMQFHKFIFEFPANWWPPNESLFFRPHAHQRDAVTRDFNFKGLVERANFFLPPEIADALVSACPKIIPRHRNFSRTGREIEQPHCLRAVLEF